MFKEKKDLKFIKFKESSYEVKRLRRELEKKELIIEKQDAKIRALAVEVDNYKNESRDEKAAIKVKGQARAKELHSLKRELADYKRAEAKLRRERNKAQIYFDIAGVIYVGLDVKGNITLLNKTACDILGCSKKDIIGKNWFENFIPAQKRKEVEAIFQKLISSEIKPAEYFENPIVTKKNEERIISWHNSVLRDESGKIVGILSSGEDITEQRQAKHALKTSQRILDSIIKTVPDIIYRLDQDGRITFISEAVKMYGYDPEELIGTDIINLVHPEDQEKVKYCIKERRTGDRRTKSLELRFSTKERVPIPFEVRTKDIYDESVFLLEAEGVYSFDKSKAENFLGTQGIARNITDRKRVERKLARMASVVEQVSESIIITDLNGKIDYVNPAFEKFTGYTFAEAIGRNPNILKSEKQDKEIYEQLWSTITSGKDWSGRLINKRKDGSLFYEDAVIFPIKDTSGSIINYAAVKRDISSKIKLENQLLKSQKMEAIGQLAGGIAHDFNNILTVINGYAELTLSKMESDNPLYSTIEQILKSGQNARNLTRQLLAFSRKQIIDPKIISINSIISDTDKMLRRLIGEDINLETILSNNLSPIKADPGQIEQILVNLIVNARDAIHQKENQHEDHKITIETYSTVLDEYYVYKHADSHVGPHIVFAVSDTGVGIEDEEIEKVFDPFYTTKGEGKGTGLGLSTVYGIVKQNNGSIYVYSEPGLGTTFKIYWPSSDEKELSENAFETQQKNINGTETILVVEDDVNVKQFTSRALKSLGYKVYDAANGQKALEMIKEIHSQVELLITDAVMPKMGGRQLAEKVKKILPSIKVLYISGYTDNHIVREGELTDGINFIEKPYTVKKLASRIRSILDAS